MTNQGLIEGSGRVLISASVYHLAFSSRRKVEDGREEEFITDKAEDCV